MNNIIVKEFYGKKIYTLMWNNKPCWISNQIVSIFGYVEPKVTINQCIEKEKFEIGVEYEILKGNDLKQFKELVKDNLTTCELISKYTSSLIIFYEDGLYGFLQYTDKPIGVQFRKWIRRDVVPEIRENGFYIGNNQSSLQNVQSSGIITKYSKLNELERIIQYFNLMKENKDLKEEIRTYTNYIDMFNRHIKDTTNMFKKLLQ